MSFEHPFRWRTSDLEFLKSAANTAVRGYLDRQPSRTEIHSFARATRIHSRSATAPAPNRPSAVPPPPPIIEIEAVVRSAYRDDTALVGIKSGPLMTI